MAKPKLCLIPATVGDKVYSILPSNGVGDFNFTRGSEATRVNAQGLIERVASGENRLNYSLLDGEVVGCPSLLLEPQRTNLIPYSEDFSQPNWSKVNATIELNSTISPDGTLNASKIIDDATNGYHRITDAFTTPSSGNFTYSIFLKKGTLTTAQFQVFDGTTAASAFVDLENGTIRSDGQGINHKIENYGNGWYRCFISGVYAGSTTTVYVYTKQKTPNYIGSGDYLYIWGAQFEEGSYATSYIPTNGSAVTRVAETCNGSGDADTFNDSEGVLMVEASSLVNSDTYRLISLNDNSNSNEIFVGFRFDTGKLYYNIDSGDVGQSSFISDVTALNTSCKFCVKYKQNDISFYINGFKLYSDPIANMPTGLSVLKMSRGNDTLPFYGNTKQIQYFDTALSDTELEQLTSWDSFRDMTQAQLYTIE